MTIDSLRASQAYAQIADIAGNAPRSPDVSEAQGTNFAELVQNAVETTQSSLAGADNAAQAVAAGEANLVDVVTSISAAEVTLETAISIRNRMIEAYQDIMRMPI